MTGLNQDAIASKHYITTLPFQAANVPDANGTMTTINADCPEYPALQGGSIVGLGVRHNADLTGGVITWTPTINGTPVTGLSVVTDDTNQQAVARKDARQIRFKAGDRLGIVWTKTGTVAPTTTDVIAQLQVTQENMRL